MAIGSCARPLVTQLGEEAVDRFPNLIAARETAPFGAYQSHQRVAAIDRRLEDIGGENGFDFGCPRDLARLATF
jgi:hypothetical protein